MLPQTLQGTTISHGKNGRKLGYPTANIDTDTLLPDGVYVGFASLDEFRRQPALLFIGSPITVGDAKRRTEAHILDIPDKDYYDKTLTMEFAAFLRPNKKFSSLDDLVAAMKRDEKLARAWFVHQALAKLPPARDTT